ncbi:MAG: shikimate dehydrogenase [Clostridiaceae bacterium]
MIEKNLYGLIGEKLSHSVSPEIHYEILKKSNIQGNYSLYEIPKEEIHKVVDSFKLLGYKGVNVTIPYKLDIMEYLDEVSDEAKQIGAVNTLYFKDGKALGYNTDYYGFGMMLEANDVDVKGKKVLLLGNGGATKSVIKYLEDNDASNIYIASRSGSDKVNENLQDKVKLISYDEIKNITDGYLVVNGTPVGMYPKVGVSPIEEDDIKRFKVAVDLIYNPLETEILKLARENGLKSVNGLYMLVGQAVKAQEIWNDIKLAKCDVDEIHETILKIFK